MTATTCTILSKDAQLTLHPRVEPVSVTIPIEDDVSTAKFDATEDIDAGAERWVTSFNRALHNRDFATLTDLFLPDSFWRDHLCLSWNFHTLAAPNQIRDFLEEGCRLRRVHIDRSSEFRKPKIAAFDGQGKICGVQMFLLVDSDVGRGVGVVRLLQQDGQLKVYTLFTSMTELKGHEEAIFGRRPEGAIHGVFPGRKTWHEHRVADENCEESGPLVLIIGAGQGGLTAAARLKMLGIKSLIVDRNERLGDSWRQRYDQLLLHDPVWYNHMPYLPFPPTWPIFTPKDKLAEFFEFYAKILELNVWMQAVVKDSKWDEIEQKWTVTLERRTGQGVVETRLIHPRHIIQATGQSGEKNFPQIPGMQDFQGDRLCHSSEYKGANMNGCGKKVIVVGSCNSGHDISRDFYEKGYHVTMIQRSSTCIASSEAILKIGLAGLYEEDGPPVEDADIIFWSIPSPMRRGILKDMTTHQKKQDAELMEGLEKVGFKLDQGPDGIDPFVKYFQRQGGYYTDVGASQLIIDGKIKLKQGQEIAQILPHGMRFADGSELEADEIIFATGYKNTHTQSRSIFGDEVADRVGDVWGFDEQEETRTIWRKSGHPGFWFFGGHLAMCRYWSRMIALQIKALEEGVCEYGDR